MNRAVTIVFICLALARCAPSDSGPNGPADQRADAATQAACRQRANEMYERQNRDQIYAPQSGVNSPASGNYTADYQIRGLGQKFAHDTMIANCIRNTGMGSERDAAAPAPAPAPTGTPR